MMFTRTAELVDVPEREQMDKEQFCPPHDFEAGWATPLDAKDHDDTVPALYCHACGETRAFRIPVDAG